MLTVKENNIYAFVGSNAKRDEHEANGTVMYDLDPVGNEAVVAFDGKRWLVPKISVEPEVG